jgi:SAM-dependent methyltransferase
MRLPHMTTWTKILILISCFYLIYRIFDWLEQRGGREGFTGDQIWNEFTFKTGPDIYDDFYASIYDQLVYSGFKTQYEIGEIVNKTTPTTQSKLLDVGCGTGHHVAEWVALTGGGETSAIGMDSSIAMIDQAKKNYPDYDFQVKDALQDGAYQPNSFTHITCLYFTFYYWAPNEQEIFLQNAMRWLKSGGFLILHLVNPEQFDPILPPANPLLLISPQKYSPKRITTSTIHFEGGMYTAEFVPGTPAKFVEKMSPTSSPTNTRKQEHILHLEPIPETLRRITDMGFNTVGQVDLVHCQYEYQYLYIFQKP